jgi:integrase
MNKLQKAPTKNSLPSTRDIAVGLDKDYLRLSWSKRIKDTFYQGKRYMPLKRKISEPGVIDWVTRLVYAIQADIDHPDGLFDPSLEKYLGTEKVIAKYKSQSNVIDFPKGKPEPKLGELWEQYCDWVIKAGKMREGTLKTTHRCFEQFCGSSKHRSLSKTLALEIQETLNNHQSYPDGKIKIFTHLKKMSDWAIANNLLTSNPFTELELTIVKQPKKQDNYRGFTLEERDIIIKAFYDADKFKFRKFAEFIELSFLTGMRHSEVYAIQWKHINLETNMMTIAKSFDRQSQTTDNTKTNVIRLFRIYPKLRELIERIKQDAITNNRFNPETKVFGHLPKGITSINEVWNSAQAKYKETAYVYPGIVTQLVAQGKISQYLSPYHTRHTFITLQTKAIMENPSISKSQFSSALKLIADSVGNSVEMIQEHYLSIDEDIQLINI